MYKNCVEAVSSYYENGEKSNVSTDTKKISCSHQATTCIISGNTQPVYTCCETEHKVPQTVYKDMSSGFGRILKK
tara:strand:- start:127 stop:351 length:225 start_codon:yes stop_codon:yes gene_type:complete